MVLDLLTWLALFMDLSLSLSFSLSWTLKLVLTSSSVSTASGFRSSPKLLVPPGLAGNEVGRAGGPDRDLICEAKSGALDAEAKLEFWLVVELERIDLLLGCSEERRFCAADFCSVAR